MKCLTSKKSIFFVHLKFETGRKRVKKTVVLPIWRYSLGMLEFQINSFLCENFQKQIHRLHLSLTKLKLSCFTASKGKVSQNLKLDPNSRPTNYTIQVLRGFDILWQILCFCTDGRARARTTAVWFRREKKRKKHSAEEPALVIVAAHIEDIWSRCWTSQFLIFLKLHSHTLWPTDHFSWNHRSSENR